VQGALKWAKTMTPYNKGFTLLEVMIALTIFALLATTMSQTTTSAVDNQLTIEQTLFANWIAENEIINLRSVPWADIKTDKTDYEMANQEWVIKKTVSIKKSFSGVAIPLEVKEVLVSVALKSQTSSLISLTAFLANE
jgi:general secretion pathway protein I